MKKYFVLFTVFSTLSATANAHDSSMVKPLGQKLKPKIYQAYVEVNDCVETDTKHMYSPGWFGWGNTNQQCPSHHPVMYQHNQYTIHASALGAAQQTSALCCAVKYRWVDAENSQTEG